MLEQQRLDLISLFVLQRLAQIDPADLGADGGLELLDDEASGEFGRTFNGYGGHGDSLHVLKSTLGTIASYES
jgi:hypothetical protein